MIECATFGLFRQTKFLKNNKKINTNKKDKVYMTALHQSCEYGHFLYTQLLAIYNAKIDIKNRLGHTSIFGHLEGVLNYWLNVNPM